MKALKKGLGFRDFHKARPLHMRGSSNLGDRFGSHIQHFLRTES